MTDFKAGDIIGFSGSDFASDLINLCTWGIPRWSLSHVGIIADPRDIPFSKSYIKPLYPPNGPLLFESTAACQLPCRYQEELIHGMQAHYPADRIAEYQGKVWHYPLARGLKPLENTRLIAFLLRHLGDSYDTIGALRAAGTGFSFLESLLHRENLSALFCSEVCAAALRHIKFFQTRNASAWNPNLLVRTMRRRELLLEPRRLK